MYRAAISNILSAVTRGLRLIRRLVSQWNLALVLEFLAGPPYEPLSGASLKYITL